MNYKLTRPFVMNVEFTVYAFLFVVINYLIYVINDETQPLIGFLRPEYLIPCVIYSSIVILISFSIFRLIKTIIQKRIALTVAVFLGAPLGIYILFQFTNWLFK